MMRYSVQSRDQIFVKGPGFLSFSKNVDKNIGKNTSKNLSGEKLQVHAKQSATDVLETASERDIQKTAEETGDLIANKIANRITKISNNSQQNKLETVINGNDKEIPKKRYITPDKKARNSC